MPGWKALPDELDPEVRAFTERLRRVIDRSGLGVTAVAERTGHERAAWDSYLNARLPAPRGAVAALADVTGTDPADLAAHWERADRVWGDHTMQIRRLDLDSADAGPRTPAPDSDAPPTPEAAPAAPVAAPGARSRRGVVLLYAAGIVGALLVVTAALLLVDLGGSDGDDERAAPAPTTTAPPVTRPATLPAGVRCVGADCTGKDPEAMGCGGELAVTVARARVGAALVEVRHSDTCAAAWARITGAAPGDTVTVEAGGAERSATVAEGADTAVVDTDAYTPMVAVGSGADARACGTLADGRAGCTAN
ncbi:helix-turn-helix domain-containing protein [Streptomyces sp. CB02261]|uniref:helix-turn-helix domain-containing protein n=1 Tax=Streptomyces sp. CB02261 TaxID=1703940 RepID=UPI000939FEE5|nr:XRE family transcriptional regulator [Streptomyces sp. CB02261]OKJ68006.1 hypothetical protein AMK29_08160 [Streptomyces sp. CB02261]